MGLLFDDSLRCASQITKQLTGSRPGCQRRLEGVILRGRLPIALSDTPVRDEDIEEFKATVLAKLTLAVGKDGGKRDRSGLVCLYCTLAPARPHHPTAWADGRPRQRCERPPRRVYYMSLGISDRPGCSMTWSAIWRCNELVRVALGRHLGVDPQPDAQTPEPDAALGNGGSRAGSAGLLYGKHGEPR